LYFGGGELHFAEGGETHAWIGEIAVALQSRQPVLSGPDQSHQDIPEYDLASLANADTELCLQLWQPPKLTTFTPESWIQQGGGR